VICGNHCGGPLIQHALGYGRQRLARAPVRAPEVVDTIPNIDHRFGDERAETVLRMAQEALRNIIRLFEPQFNVVGKPAIAAEYFLTEPLPEIDADAVLLHRAFQNLVLNAVDAMPEGGQLRVVLSRRGDMAEIAVGDTGRGISPENRQKIFQLFFTTRPGGSGIGLASTFRIVQLHNGSIDFTSEVGRGTTFRIELPLAA